MRFSAFAQLEVLITKPAAPVAMTVSRPTGRALHRRSTPPGARGLPGGHARPAAHSIGPCRSRMLAAAKANPQYPKGAVRTAPCTACAQACHSKAGPCPSAPDTAPDGSVRLLWAGAMAHRRAAAGGPPARFHGKPECRPGRNPPPAHLNFGGRGGQAPRAYRMPQAGARPASSPLGHSRARLSLQPSPAAGRHKGGA